MVFALERTQSALYLLSLEKNSTGYRINHYDKRSLHHASHHDVSTLQDMCSALNTPKASIILGINDADVILRHIHLDTAVSPSKMYQRTQAILAEELPIKQYSWDAHPLSAFKGAGHYLLCAAYPLEKIQVLQETFNVCNLSIKALEPSICALARVSFILFNLPEVLFLLQENNLFTLMLSVQGQVFALRHFKQIEMLEETIASLPIKPERIIVMNDEQIPENLFQDLQFYRYGLQAEGPQLFSPLGLALRQYT